MVFRVLSACLAVLCVGCTAIPINIPQDDKGIVGPIADASSQDQLPPGGDMNNWNDRERGVGNPDAGPLPYMEGGVDAAGDGGMDAMGDGGDSGPGDGATDAVFESLPGDGQPQDGELDGEPLLGDGLAE